MEHEVGDQELDALGPALDRARQPAGLPLQVEAQRQRVQVLKHVDGDQAERTLLYLGEDPVPDLVGGERDHPDDPYPATITTGTVIAALGAIDRASTTSL